MPPGLPKNSDPITASINAAQDEAVNLFCGYASAAEAQEKIDLLTGQLNGNLVGDAYSTAFIDAAAALMHFDSPAFRRVGNHLETLRLPRGRWETTIKDRLKQEEKRLKALDQSAEKSDSIATQLVKLARANATVFHDSDDCFATIQVDQHQETHGLGTRAFKRWLAHLFLQSAGIAPSGEAISTALNTLSGIAQYQGEEQPTFIRVGGFGGRIYIDLVNKDWQVIEVLPALENSNGTSAYWRIIDSNLCPIKFRRANGMRPLPMPVHGGDISELQPFVNVADTEDDKQFTLFVGALLGALRDTGPYPVLAVQGEPGSAKSTVSKIFRDLTDPNTSSLRRLPRESRDLAIAAGNSWTCIFNNVSDIPKWLSNDICCLSTGGGFSTRALYTDDEEKIFNAMRPVVLNGIGGFAVKGDLVDRTISLNLPQIPEENRKLEADMNKDFSEAAPRILGALLDAVSMGLVYLPEVKATIDRIPRMADFACWAEACTWGLGWVPGQFLDAYRINVGQAAAAALETPLITALMKVGPLPWDGSATELLNELVAQATEKEAKQDTWPKNPAWLGIELRQLAPNLRKTGLDIEFGRATRRRTLFLSRNKSS